MKRKGTAYALNNPLANIDPLGLVYCAPDDSGGPDPTQCVSDEDYNQNPVTCYAYDALHRLTSVTYPSGGYSSVTPAKYYVYDSATVDSAAMSYAKSRLAEAYKKTRSPKE
jgi:YD repeat-containing protein